MPTGAYFTRLRVAPHASLVVRRREPGSEAVKQRNLPLPPPGHNVIVLPYLQPSVVDLRSELMDACTGRRLSFSFADTRRLRADWCYGKAHVTSNPSRPQSLAKTPARKSNRLLKVAFLDHPSPFRAFWPIVCTRATLLRARNLQVHQKVLQPCPVATAWQICTISKSVAWIPNPVAPIAG
ncbi:hypothetical protein LY76DRAFT_31568 [Colletotrichum caudatum]|nr:hypothetical protein LY76DRAFT_31568 [Colletotrichum caudatum]